MGNLVSIYVWALVLLIATNVFVVLFSIFVVYLIFGVLDLTYHQRHRTEQKEREQAKKCPEEIESEDKR